MSDPTSLPVRSVDPWIVASRCTPAERAATVASLRDVVPVIDRAAVGTALGRAVRRRSSALERRVDELRETLATAEQPDDVEDERVYLTQLAEWCDQVPQARADAARVRDDALDEVSRRSVTLRTAERALDDVLAQRAVAERALADARLELEARAEPHRSEADIRTELEQLAGAADAGADRETSVLRIKVLERRLEIRAAAPDPGRDATVAALADQAAMLELRLTEAVDAARQGVAQARADFERAEADVDRLDAEARQRERKLREAADELPTPEPWTVAGDLSGRARDLAAALRTAAAALRPEDLVPRAGLPDPVELRREIGHLEAQIGVLQPSDVVAAVAELTAAAAELTVAGRGAAAAGTVVLDEPVVGAGSTPFLDALRSLESRPEVVLMSDDATVWAWLDSLPVGEARIVPSPDVVTHLTDLTGVVDRGAVSPGEPATAAAGVVSIETLRAFSHRPEASRRDPS